MLNLRKASINDKKVLQGLYEFILSLELDILKETGNQKFFAILEECFNSNEDRFSHKYCDVVEKDEEILGFSFSYHYDKVETCKKYWYEHIVKKYNLSEKTIIFDYNEALEEEFYLDTLYVFEENRGQGIGTELLKHFFAKDYNLKSLNVAQSNTGARKLYESFGMKKDGEIWIGHENYDHLVIKK